MLDKNSKIYVAGHRGLVGSAIWNNLKKRGYENLVGRTHQELDLTDQLTATGVLETPATTTFSFVTARGEALVEGIDYAVAEQGKFLFLKAQTEKVYAVLSNEGFPLFTGTNAFKTTEFEVEAVTEFSVTVGEGYTAYSPVMNLNFTGTGIDVYTAKRTDDYVVLTKVESGLVPAGTGVILAGTTGTVAVRVAAEAAALADNELVGVTGQTAVAYAADGGKYNYILQGGVFKKATGDKLKAGKAYLSTAYDAAAGSRLTIVVGETTGIRAIGHSQTANDGAVYTLSGQRVQKAAKGLYIVNGKKINVKFESIVNQYTDDLTVINLIFNF